MSTLTSPRSAPVERKECPKCGSNEPWGFASWCPSCGYYPAVGATVNVPKDERVDFSERPTTFLDVFPPWTWLVAAGSFAIIGMSVWVRITASDDSGYRTAWTLLQTAVGLTALIAGQVSAYLFAVTLSDTWGPFDMIMKPFTIWKPTFSAFPRGRWRVFLGVWGLVTVLAALLAVGGIDYLAVFETGGKKKKAANPIFGMVKHARPAEPDEDMSMEDAMEQFAGNAVPETDEPAPEDEEKKTNGVPPGNTADCVVFGYTEDGADRFGLLLLATRVDDRMKFVATLTAESLRPEMQSALAAKLKGLRTDVPLVRTAYAAVWVSPQTMIRVSHKGWTRDKRLKHAEFVDRLPDVDPSKALKKGTDEEEPDKGARKAKAK